MEAGIARLNDRAAPPVRSLYFRNTEYPTAPVLPDSASLIALRAWFAGVGAHVAVERYCAMTIRRSGALRCHQLNGVCVS